jgi:hypothetical protein
VGSSSWVILKKLVLSGFTLLIKEFINKVGKKKNLIRGCSSAVSFLVGWN